MYAPNASPAGPIRTVQSAGIVLLFTAVKIYVSKMFQIVIGDF